MKRHWTSTAACMLLVSTGILLAAAPERTGIRIVVVSGDITRKPLLGDQVASEHTVIVMRAEGVPDTSAVQWTTPDNLSVVKLKDDTELHVAGAPGTYVIKLETLTVPDIKQKPIWQRTSLKLTIVGKVVPVPPGPVPPPGPTPPPVPPVPVDPAPIAADGLRMMIVEESGDRTKLAAGQLRVISSVALRMYIRSKQGTKPAAGEPFRIYDKDQDTSGDSKEWQDALAAAKAKPGFAVPWLVVSNGKTGDSVPLPKTFEETMNIIKKHGG